MKINVALSIAMSLAFIGFANGKAPEKQDQPIKQLQAKVQPAPLMPKATGPSGFGAITLGMTKAEVEALQATDGVFSISKMIPYVRKTVQPEEGVGKFDASIVTPLSTTPLKTVLTFSEGKLTELYMEIDEPSNLLDRMKAQITEKYGVGKVKDEREEEQCIYKNGANFKITTGLIGIEWEQTLSAGERVLTRLSDYKIDGCPSNLSYTNIGAISSRGLTIRKINNKTNPSSKNLF